MTLSEQLGAVQSREEFSLFLELLSHADVRETCANADLSSYFAALSRWTEDVGDRFPPKIDWNSLANLFYIGLIYE